jgi:hypothetical protein
MKLEILSLLGMKLWPEQQDVFDIEALLVLMVGGEGSGKTTIGALKALTSVLVDGAPVGLGWFVGSIMEDATKGIREFQKFAELLGVLDRGGSTISSHDDQKFSLHIVARAHGNFPAVDTRVDSVSAHDPLQIGREDLDFIVGEEVSRWEVEAWHRCLGRLARKKHAWGYFSGSPETSYGWFHDEWKMGQQPNDKNLVSMAVPSSANRTLYEKGESDPKLSALRSDMTEERYRTRHLAIFGAPHNAVIPEFKETLHVHPVSMDPNLPVHIFIDPGTHLYAVEFVQFVGSAVKVLDEVYIPHATHEQVIQATTMKHAWANVRAGVIDVAGTQHHFGFGSPEEAWYRDTGIALQAKYHLLDRVTDRLRGVMATDPITQRPYLTIDPKCRGLIVELGGGRSFLPGRGLWVMKGEKPSTANCDGAKALGYGLLTHLGSTRPRAPLQSLDDIDDSEVLTYLSPARQERSLEDLIRSR